MDLDQKAFDEMRRRYPAMTTGDMQSIAQFLAIKKEIVNTRNKKPFKEVVNEIINGTSDRKPIDADLKKLREERTKRLTGN